ncbi:MAG: hypothetical protein ACI87E_004825 [Mariniblastus sp.]|jgi:hypothetical protein
MFDIVSQNQESLNNVYHIPTSDRLDLRESCVILKNRRHRACACYFDRQQAIGHLTLRKLLKKPSISAKHGGPLHDDSK